MSQTEVGAAEVHFLLRTFPLSGNLDYHLGNLLSVKRRM
jgi:hypothetical protein